MDTLTFNQLNEQLELKIKDCIRLEQIAKEVIDKNKELQNYYGVDLREPVEHGIIGDTLETKHLKEQLEIKTKACARLEQMLKEVYVENAELNDRLFAANELIDCEPIVEYNPTGEAILAGFEKVEKLLADTDNSYLKVEDLLLDICGSYSEVENLLENTSNKYSAACNLLEELSNLVLNED